MADNLGAGAELTAIASGTADVQGKAAATGLRLLGFSVRESAGTPAAAEVILRHGTADTDSPIAFITLAADGSANVWYGPAGLAVANGIFVDRVSGTTELVLYTRTVP